MKYLTRILAVFVASCFLLAQGEPVSRAESKPRRYLETGGERKLDLVYKKVLQKQLALDLYYPIANRESSSPVVIYTHGGGWAAGSKLNISRGVHSKVALKLLEAGFCVASVDYRLCKKGTGVMMRDCVIDSKDAVRYLANHAESLGLDPQRFFAFGDSAGGQIAQMILLTDSGALPGDPQLVEATYRMVAGVSFYGPCDFEKEELFNHDDRPDFRDRFGPRILGSQTDPADKLRLYREMSPVRYLEKDSAPLLMIQGDQDTTIPVKHARYMKEKADEVQAPVEVLIIENAGHNWRRVNAPIKPTTEQIVEQTVQFFTRQLEEKE
ncbi:alpha/beta hydrolase [Roseibacillus persicicus]|uniref:BD-FAE-like domain-containing protein n=1 Tax=Roseibacillus persicicus TaxID=454148 RepID=A0A918TG01_9BACT|nr:alpha/beta hydrolase [Roseibacillus persicicus]GHC46838.1 hypothetical protein GCM10007100_10650 [Roseibacillus persicicus]